MFSDFSDGGFMMWIILFLDLLLLLFVVVAFSASFMKGRGIVLQVTAVISSFIPVLLGAIAWLLGARTANQLIDVTAVQDPAMMDIGSRTATVPLIMGISSTTVLLLISVTALVIRRSRQKREEDQVEFV